MSKEQMTPCAVRRGPCPPTGNRELKRDLALRQAGFETMSHTSALQVTAGPSSLYVYISKYNIDILKHTHTYICICNIYLSRRCLYM